LLPLNVGLFAFVVKTVLFDAQLKVLAQLVAVENLAGAQSDVVFAAQRPPGAPGGDGDLFQLLLSGSQ